MSQGVERLADSEELFEEPRGGASIFKLTALIFHSQKLQSRFAHCRAAGNKPRGKNSKAYATKRLGNFLVLRGLRF